MVGIKPFDYCMLLCAFQLEEPTSECKNGGDRVEPPIVLLYRSIKDGKHCPVHKSYQRADLFLGITILSPSNNKNKKGTKFWSLSHTSYPSVPPALADRKVFSGSLEYTRQLRQVAPALAAAMADDLRIVRARPLPTISGQFADLIRSIELQFG